MSTALQSAGGWREAILSQFTPTIAAFSPITVVADPDRLLAEQKLLSGMNERGFEVVSFDDPIALRYLYESRFRGRDAHPKSTRLVIAATDGNQAIPFDIRFIAVQSSRVLSFGLAALFPHLTPNVVAELDRDDLDALFRAQQIHQPEQLGENATRDFILRHVCEVAPELIWTPSDLLRVLLRRHYQQRQYPPSIDQRFISLVRSNGRFSDWPLETIVPDRGIFIAFLQERWNRLIQAKAGQALPVEHLTVAGPADLPFEHPDIRVYIDNLCLEGVLKPVQRVSKETIGDSWLAVGVMAEAREAVGERFKKLTAHLIAQIPGPDSVHTGWAAFAYRWAEWNVLRHQLANDESASLAASASDTQAAVDTAFESWLLNNYSALGSLSYLPRPVMVHQIAWSMAYGWAPSLTSKKKH